MIMTNFTQSLKLVNFFQTAKFSNKNISFQNYIALMYRTTFPEVISAKRFSYGLCLNSSSIQAWIGSEKLQKSTKD
jgi:hypothetical protein